jgi:hypothetical protein
MQERERFFVHASEATNLNVAAALATCGVNSTTELCPSTHVISASRLKSAGIDSTEMVWVRYPAV